MGKEVFDSTKLERLLLMYQMIKAEPELQPKDIQDRLGIEKTSFGRYRKTLGKLGVEFHYDKKTKRHVITKDAFLTASDLTLDERLAIVLAIGQLGRFQESFLAAKARQAVCKLLAVNDASVNTACHCLLQPGERSLQHGAAADVVDRLFTAVTERRKIKMTYRKPDSTQQTYNADPLQLYLVEQSLYLDCYVWERKAIRCFKVCRISSVHLSDMIFSNTHGYDYAARRGSAFGVFATDKAPEIVRVWFSVAVAPYIREDFRHATQKIKDNADNSIVYEVSVDEPREVLWWAMRWGGDFEVLEPQWLRDEAKEKVKKMAGRYEMKVEG